MAIPFGVAQLSELRDRLELMLSINTGDPYVDSTSELQDINEGYQATAYSYDWPQLLTRVGIVKVANLDRYGLPTNFRKSRTVRLDGSKLIEVELESLRRSRQSFTVDPTQNDIIVKPVPTAASTAYTLSNSESAGNAVTIELDTVSGLTAHDEIWVDSAAGTDEFTMVSSIDTSTTSIVARLFAAKSASDIFYRADDIIDLLFYRRVTLLSASSDTMLLPQSVDYISLFKSASIAFGRLEMYDEAERNEKMWRDQMAEAWLASDKLSTGAATYFSV